MSKVTLIPHVHDEPHATESDWRSVIDLLEQHANDLGVRPDYLVAVTPLLAALAGENIAARLDVTDPARPVVISVEHDVVKINTVDRPIIEHEGDFRGPRYQVTWVIDADEADSPRAAAEWAREIQRDPSSQAGCFTVRDNKTAQQFDVDLDQDEA